MAVSLFTSVRVPSGFANALTAAKQNQGPIRIVAGLQQPGRECGDGTGASGAKAARLGVVERGKLRAE